MKLRLLAHLTLWLFPTAWALHVTGGCFCRTRAECRHGGRWPASRADLKYNQVWG